MEAKNVTVYYKPKRVKEKDGRFYNFYIDSALKVHLSNFINATIEVQEMEDKIENIPAESLMEVMDDINQHTQKTSKVTAIYPSGIEKEYSVVCTFQNVRDGKKYLVYTNNTYDKKNMLIMMALVYDENLPEPFIGYPTSKEAWNDIINLIDCVLLNDNES